MLTPEKTGPTSARLGGARADFVAGLGKKVQGLRESLARVRASGNSGDGRDELRRKLHALSSAAKMMKFDAMDRALAEALGAIDKTGRESSLDVLDLDGIEQIVEDLPALAWGDGKVRSSRAEVLERPAPKYNVLVVGSSIIAEALLDEGPEQEGPEARPIFLCESTPDAQAAFDIVRVTEPDLVVLDADLASATELVEALMDNPLTETVPIVVVGSFLEQGEAARYVAMGVAKTVGKPTSREALRAACEDTLVPARVIVDTGIGDPTLEELGDRLAAEIREALVGRADPLARQKRIPIGQGTEVLGAVWGAIARVREVVTARSDGSVRFAAGPEGAFTPGPLLCEPDVARSDRLPRNRRGAAAEVRLAGRKIVVADDDPGVVWFLADLLKTAGCIVHEAFDGQQALELAYKTSPDLVISDILMPKLDGFSLCRALRRDVALRDVPVILLSWKEDLLQRVRELGAEAAGYVRKESDTRAIIARVREALRTRGRIEARLREEGEVRGRLDGVSIKTLLEVVCATRPEARVSVRDAQFLYEIEIRWGAPHRATRTSGDGGFIRGSRVLTALLGVSAGRFTVTTSTAALEAELDGNLAAQLAKPVARARAAMMLLTGPEMAAVGRIRLDDDALDDYLQATPEKARLVARRLSNGAPPRELVLCGGCEPALLDDLLCELAARGFVTGIEGLDGQDLLQPTVKALLEHSDTRASFAPRTATPSPVPALIDALAPPAAEAAAEEEEPIEESPSSLEDAVLREVSVRSPEPAQVTAKLVPQAAAPLVDPQTLKPRTSPPPPPCNDEYGTPMMEQLLTFAEPTVVDENVVYGERSVSIKVEMPEEMSDALLLEQQKIEDLTPFGLVGPTQDAAPATPKKKTKKWPLLAFFGALGAITWAAFHFGAMPMPIAKQQNSQPPPSVDEFPVTYTPVAPTAVVPTDHGVIDVSAPADSVVLIDGKESARGSATVPAKAGAHEIKVRKPAAPTSDPSERGCTIDVHSSRVAHVRF